jgi:hypothetical protein
MSFPISRPPSCWRGFHFLVVAHAVQVAGHDHLRKLGVTLIPATAPDFFTEDTPTAVLVRQVLGAIAQFDKATTIAKLKAARDRILQTGEKCGARGSAYGRWYAAQILVNSGLPYPAATPIAHDGKSGDGQNLIIRRRYSGSWPQARTDGLRSQ